MVIVILNAKCPLQVCVSVLPGDLAFIRTWYELAESHWNLCTLISITALDCFLYYCPFPPPVICPSGYSADWTATWCPRCFPKHLLMVEVKRWIVGLYPWEGISQEKRPTEINIGKSLGLWGRNIHLLVFYFSYNEPVFIGKLFDMILP